MLGFELSLGKAFEFINVEEHLMGFVSRDGAKFISHLLNLVCKVSHFIRLVKVLIVWLKGLDSFHPRDRGLSIFVS